MTTAQKFRPARRIPAARLVVVRAAHAARCAAGEQAREDQAAQRLNPTPEYATAPRLTALPGGLHWSARQPVPAVGATVTRCQSGQPEPLTVLGYCHAAGFLGLVTEPQHPDSRKARRMHPRAHCVFAHQLALAA